MKIRYVNRIRDDGISYASVKNTEALKNAGVTLVDSLELGLNCVLLHTGALPTIEEFKSLPIHNAIKKGIPVIAYWVIEGDEATSKVLDASRGLSQIWTPSECSAEAIRKAGVTVPVKVIPHVIKTDCPLLNPVSEPFTIITCSSTAPLRKGHKYAVEMFFKAFPLNDYPNVRWLIKFQKRTKMVRELKNLLSHDPRISFIVRHIPDMSKVYASASVALQPQLAGAFELHCAEIASLGVPVISTKTGGVIDYLDNRNLIPVNGFIDIQKESEILQSRNHGQFWSIPDVDAGAKLLRDCYDNYAVWAANAKEQAMVVRNRCQLDSVSEKMNECLAELPDVTYKITEVGVFSHRRSGTHLLAEYLKRGWEVNWLKSHDFPSQLRSDICWIYTVRNPIDCIYKTFHWFSSLGNSRNVKLAEVVDGLTFEEYLDGKGASIIGFSDMYIPRFDNLRAGRAMFYDPIRYWLDHVRSAIDFGNIVSVYEKLISNPDSLNKLVSLKIGEAKNEVVSIDKPTGLFPHMDKVGQSLSLWKTEHVEKLVEGLNTPFGKQGKSILEHLEFQSIEEWIKTGQK